MPRRPRLTKKNGYWYTRAGNPNGVYFGRVGDVDYRTAQRLFGDYLGSLSAARPAPQAAVTAVEICDEFLAWVQQNRGARTFDERKRHLDRFCSFERGSGRMADLAARDVRGEHLERFLAHVREDHGTGDFTTDKHATSVKAAFNWASKQGRLLPADFRPFSGIEKYKRPVEALAEHDLLRAEEMEALLSSADADLAAVTENGRRRRRAPEECRVGPENPYVGFRDLLLCYWHTGARTSELVACRVRDFHAPTRQLVLGKHKRVRTMRDPRPRQMTLNDEALSVVRRQVVGKEPDGYVFDDPRGNPWTRFSLAQRFARVRARAGVRDDVTIYSFRHLWISEALMAGNDVATIARMAGTSIAMIEKVYGHFTTDHLREAQARLDGRRKRPFER